jgi:LysR family transcriptional regulator, transcriptional activator of the cysJI operon
MANLENFRLVVFRAVAEQQSFRKAAEELYLTQPAVSLQIKALEEELGVQLFDRSGPRAGLTPAGTILLDHARRVHHLLAQAEDRIAALSGDHAGKLTLGASTTIAQYVLPRLLGEFCAENPRIELTLMSGNTEHIVNEVRESKIPLGFIEGPPRARDVRTEPFLRDEILLIAPAAHEWAERGSATCADLTSTPLLMRERGSGTRRITEMALEKQGLKCRALHIAMELDSTEAIKSAVEAGLGVGFVSRWAIAKDLRLGKSFKIVEMKGLRIHRDFLLVTAKGPELQGPAKEFRRFLAARTGTRRASSDAQETVAPKGLRSR